MSRVVRGSRRTQTAPTGTLPGNSVYMEGLYMTLCPQRKETT